MSATTWKAAGRAAIALALLAGAGAPLGGCAAQRVQILDLDARPSVGAAAAVALTAAEAEEGPHDAPEPAAFRGVVIETEPENATIVASGRHKSKSGRLRVPVSADAYTLPRAFTVTISHRDYPTIRRKIETRLDWARFFMVAGPISIVALGYAVPLLDPARTGAEKLTAGLTVAGTAVSIAQILLQSHKFDDVYVIDLEEASRR